MSIRSVAAMLGSALAVAACASVHAPLPDARAMELLVGTAGRIFVGDLEVHGDHRLRVGPWWLAVYERSGPTGLDLGRVRALAGQRVIVIAWDSLITSEPFVVAATRGTLGVGLESDLEPFVQTLVEVESEPDWFPRAKATERGSWARFLEGLGNGERRNVTDAVHDFVETTGMHALLLDINGWYARTASRPPLVWPGVGLDFDDRLFHNLSDRMFARAIADKALGVNLYDAGITLCDGYASSRRLWVLLEYLRRRGAVPGQDPPTK